MRKFIAGERRRALSSQTPRMFGRDGNPIHDATVLHHQLKPLNVPMIQPFILNQRSISPIKQLGRSRSFFSTIRCLNVETAEIAFRLRRESDVEFRA